MRRKAGAFVALVFLSGCSSPAALAPGTDVAAQSHDATVQSLDGGKLDGLPTGGVFGRVIQFQQPEGYTILSKERVPGFVFVESGVHRLTLLGQAPTDIAAGHARFHPSISHVHFNPGPGLCMWYFVAVWSSSGRAQPPVDPIAKFVFQSANISPVQLPQGTYSEVLRQVTLGGGGRSEAHQFGGLSLFFVLQGSLTIRSQRGSSELSPHEGAAYLPDVPLQEVNRADVPVVYLEMLITATEREFEVPLLHAPVG